MLIGIYIIASSLFTSLLSLVGALVLTVSQKKIARLTAFLVSLSAGVLLGDAFFHLLPEALLSPSADYVWIFTIAGILLFFVLEKIIHWRHCHLQPNKNHPHPVGMMNLVGDGLHNFTDGMVIAASFLVDIRLGVATTIAIISHEIPQELGDFATLLYAGYKAKKALLLNLLSGLASVLGALLVIFLGKAIGNFSDYVLPFAAGGFIYIAASDLIPELKKESRLSDSARQLLGIVLGLIIMIVLKNSFE